MLDIYLIGYLKFGLVIRLTTPHEPSPSPSPSTTATPA